MNSIASLGNSQFQIGAGAQLQHVCSALRCQENMTIPCGSCNTVGFGGIAQGGGFGYLQQAHGITLYRVRSARVVLADGTVVDASPEADADLARAIRGAGGGSLCVVTDFSLQAVHFKTIHVIAICDGGVGIQ
jgi:FAD/FMN-containing dehydrogenase